MTDARIPIGAGATSQALDLRLANRHGLIAGATGTGKTVTLQVLAEGFSRAGVPVFMADVKGDLAGLSQPGTLSERIAARLRQMAITDWAPAGSPAVFWDLFGEQGHPVRTTVSEMGPLLLARVLELNDTQEGVLNVVFRLADDDGLLLLDLADLRAMLAFAAEHAADVSRRYGNVSATSVSAIQRRLLVLEQQGAAGFFGEPALELADLMRTDAAGRGRISILAADRLLQSPRLYATFLLWLLAELFEDRPEIGDQDKPRLVFFFDEAHLLFDDAPRTLVARIEQVVRLIRSKGVGVYFITQSPLDLPDTVLGQLGNRVQHALRAFTPADQKTVRAVAQTFRVNPAFDPVAAVTELEVGEALVSTLDASGAPTMVERTRIRPPCSRIGAISAAERAACLAASPVAGRYDRGIDRISAHEVLADRARAADSAQAAERAPPPAPRRYEAPLPAPRAGRPPGRAPAGRRGDSVGEALAKSVARSVGSTVGRQIVRGILGALFRGR